MVVVVVVRGFLMLLLLLLLVVVVVVVGSEGLLMPPRTWESQCRCSRGQVAEEGEEDEEDEGTGARAATGTHCCVPSRKRLTAASQGACWRTPPLLLIIVESGVSGSCGRSRFLLAA